MHILISHSYDVRLCRIFKWIYNTVDNINKWLEHCRIRVYAAQASFFITISAIPFLLLIITIAGYIMPSSDSAVRQAITARVPEEFRYMVGIVLDEVSSKSNIPLISVGALTLLWSATRGIRGIGEGICNVYGGERKKGFVGDIFRSVGYTLIYIFAVVATLATWVLGDIISGSYTEQTLAVKALEVLNGGALIIILSAVFAFTFRGFAGKKLGFFSQLPGAVFSAVGWFVYSAVFEFYIDNYARYSYIYGSLTSLIVVMLWLYSCMELLLVGAGINDYIETENRRKAMHHFCKGSPNKSCARERGS